MKSVQCRFYRKITWSIRCIFPFIQYHWWICSLTAAWFSQMVLPLSWKAGSIISLWEPQGLWYSKKRLIGRKRGCRFFLERDSWMQPSFNRAQISLAFTLRSHCCLKITNRPSHLSVFSRDFLSLSLDSKSPICSHLSFRERQKFVLQMNNGFFLHYYYKRAPGQIFFFFWMMTTNIFYYIKKKWKEKPQTQSNMP